MKKFLVLFFLFSICFVSCAGEDDDDGVSVGGGSGPCKGVICSGHGTCYEIGDNLVSCNCEEGYVAEGIDCVLDDGNGNGTDTGSDPCAGVTCSGHGTCYEKDGKPACNCEQGYDAQGTNCVEEGSSDPCAGKDCNNHGTCNSSTGQCECEEGWKGDNCESFDNGGPWKVTVSGDVNEEIEFKYIWCRESTSQTDSNKHTFQIGFHKDKSAQGDALYGRIENEFLKENIFSSKNGLIEGGLQIVNKQYNGSIGDSIVEIEVTKYKEKESFGGTLKFIGPLTNFESNNKLTISPNKFTFECPCVEDDDSLTSYNCPGPE